MSNTTRYAFYRKNLDTGEMEMICQDPMTIMGIIDPTKSIDNDITVLVANDTAADTRMKAIEDRLAALESK